MSHTQIALLPEDEVGHHDVEDHGPQEQAVEVEGGVLTRISRFSNPANHSAPIHLSINHPHLQVIQSLITQHL